jgi:hypothetical protein
MPLSKPRLTEPQQNEVISFFQKGFNSTSPSVWNQLTFPKHKIKIRFRVDASLNLYLFYPQFTDTHLPVWNLDSYFEVEFEIQAMFNEYQKEFLKKSIN